MSTDLCWLGRAPAPAWSHGAVIVVEDPSVAALASVLTTQATSAARATLFWDAAFGPPRIDAAYLGARRCDVTHAGLAAGTGALPPALDYVAPVWMWNVDPPATIEATSWRLSLRCALIAHDVIRQLGSLHTGFESLDAAALELGHRYLTRGAFVRHDPALLPRAAPSKIAISPHDDLLFVRLRYGAFWARWALGRGLLTGTYGPDAVAALRVVLRAPAVPLARYVRAEAPAALPRDPKVSVVLPTIERYPYLRQLLPQLRAQTVPVHEIIIIDQSPAEARDATIASEFPDLPIQVVYLDPPGQCSARNEALRMMTGEYALFIDDDDEVEPDLVERHLRTMATYDVDVCCGVNEEAGAGPVPEYQQFLRASDIFPTNNSMIRRRVLRDSGMFDLAYDRKMAEDGDLGIRMYLAGALMILDPRISVFHHRAPRGGLRVHGARAQTYASSRKQVTHRNLPHVAEVYLGMRYFTARQVREMLWLRAVGTLRSKDSRMQQLLKAAYGLAAMPDTVHKIRGAAAAARALLGRYPQIEALPE